MDSAHTELRADDDLWAPKRQMTLSQARTRSKRVGALRLALATGAIVCLGVLAGHLAASAVDRTTQPEPDSFRTDEIVTMLNPRFTGRDAKGRPYVITAETAQRRRSNEDLIDLFNPELIDSEGGKVTAPTGLYDRIGQTLELYEDVRMDDSSGYVFTSTHARIFVRDDRVEGLDPLKGVGPVGDVRADTYEVLEDGDVIILRGNVFTTIYPEDDAADAPAAPEEPS